MIKQWHTRIVFGLNYDCVAENSLLSMCLGEEVVSNINIQFHTQIARDRACNTTYLIAFNSGSRKREKDEWSKKSKKSESKPGAL
jgi:hypothetical protein